MKKQGLILSVVITYILSASCKRALDPKNLVGKWNYIKVENPYSPNPPDTVSKTELAENVPYIRLSANGVLMMVWGHRVLSHGTYKITDQNIVYTEQLPDNKTRTFPFWIKKLDYKEIVFETKEDDAIRVTAKKE